MRCKGFRAGGVAAGLKKNKGMDLGIIFSEVPAAGAAVFTRNRVQAAPVVLDRERIRSGNCRGVIVNSGNANCCTGVRGLRDAAAMARAAADALGIPDDQVLVASTGVIGQFLPIEKVEAAIPDLVASLRPDGFDDLARAIMTTDKVPKLVSREGRIGDRPLPSSGSRRGRG
jgi:glutamate N-acetyltransferase / amino-acid N-acetyltransferase